MTAVSESVEGVYLHDLDPGSVLDVETKSRRYNIKYVGGDEILISGHTPARESQRRDLPLPLAREILEIAIAKEVRE